MSIRILPPLVVNRIAAGEVVERPASVVKELTENAMDAGAKTLDITIHQGGRNLIRIHDNGHGMSPDELPLALERYATSKLEDDTLLTINHFGFRGEALPTIASVSRLSISSHKKGTHEAWKIMVEGGLKHDVVPISLPEGTVVEVRDLFYATPARLKFLKSERTELQQIQELIKKFALVHPSISFTLNTEQGVNLHYPATTTDLDGFKQRITQVLGKEFKDNLLPIQGTHQGLELKGFIGLPTFNRKTSAYQFFYVNQRPIQSRLLQGTLRAAYQDVLGHDSYPIAILFLTLPTDEVDVNVHPAKTEVRFRDDSLIRHLVYSCAKDAIRQHGHHTSTTVSDQALQLLETRYTKQGASEQTAPTYPSSSSPYVPSKHSHPLHSLYQPLSPSGISAHEQSSKPTLFEPIPPSLKTEQSESEPNFSSDIQALAESHPLGAAKCQLHKTYIVAQTHDSIIIVDQHAAHERITLEKLKTASHDKTPHSQRLLIPEVIEAHEAAIEKLMDLQSFFQKLGLFYERFGDAAIIVKSLPSLFKDVNPKELMRDVLDELHEHGVAGNVEERINHRLATYACHHSIRAGRFLSIAEMNQLLRDMESTPLTGQCNHGRPTYVKLSLNDIERLFGRKE
ncbi:MAG: DNA mismatch repair endonuclease MutL [Alphaproteobacteria bacterium]|nr:DNA mismatch repair endonuclease MutL [Alphaproteobacteria bacterium]